MERTGTEVSMRLHPGPFGDFVAEYRGEFDPVHVVRAPSSGGTGRASVVRGDDFAPAAMRNRTPASGISRGPVAHDPTFTSSDTVPSPVLQNSYSPESRAHTGARLLDTVRPGWAFEIDVESLQISSAEDCTLGQLFGSYDAGSNAVCPGHVYDRATWARTHGFRALAGTDDQIASDYIALTAAWRLEVAARLSGPTVTVERVLAW